MTEAPHSPSILRRALGATAMYVVGIPMIVIGLLFAFSIVAVDTVGRRYSRRLGP
jgi:hypothetical protein